MTDVRHGGTRGWVVGRAVGAPVVVSPGWAVAAVVLTVLLAPNVAGYVPGSDVLPFALAAVVVVLLLGSVLIHELAHAVVARRRGVAVQEIAVTLLGGHTRMGGAASSPATSAVIAVAGPVANIGLAALAWVAATSVPAGVGSFLLESLALANGVVGVFNLVPGLPLDGGRILEALVWRLSGRRETGTVVAGWVGRAVAVAVVAWALVPPLLAGQSPDLTRIIWGALVGAFLWSAATQAVRAGRVGRSLAGLNLRDLMSPAVAVPATSSVAALQGLTAASTPGGAPPALGPGRAGDPSLVGHPPAGELEVVLVAADGAPVGYVDRAAARAVPGALQATTPLDAVSVPLPPGAVVAADLTGTAALQAAAEATRRAAVLVAVGPDGDVVGLLHSRDLVAAVRRAQGGAT